MARVNVVSLPRLNDGPNAIPPFRTTLIFLYNDKYKGA